MEQYIFDDGNGLWYERCGDYYVPCLTLPEEKPVGIWGRRYRRWLKEHRRVTYNEMLMSGISVDHTPCIAFSISINGHDLFSFLFVSPAVADLFHEILFVDSP